MMILNISMLKKIILLSSCLLIFVNIAHSQELPQIIVSEITSISPFPIPHLGKYADRKIVFKLSNDTQHKITVFGVELGGELHPIRYVLSFNKKTNDWQYPTRNNQPIPWEKVSQQDKKEKILNPGESVTFDLFLSSVVDCGISYKVTAQIKMNKSKKTQEIRSNEFMAEPCK